mmetsp:Transcript_22202/g.55965  ORF Transcript_22202/g.55965 Transcript_22202/m.55965 type:complete len:324 (-) Transcript_22202:2128-3099(-)
MSEGSDSEDAEEAAPLPDLTDPDFAQFVNYLGVGDESIVEDETLLKIVQEAYVAPLPPNWSEFSDPEGRIYFYNYATEQSSWAHPTDKTYRELIQMVKKVRAVQPPKEEISRIIDVHLQSIHQRAMEAIQGFSGPYISDGNHEYYYNEITKVSTWESPVTEWEHNISTRYHVLYRCLLEPFERAAADDHHAQPDGSIPSSLQPGPRQMPPKLQLPLHLVSTASSSSVGSSEGSSSLPKARSSSDTSSGQTPSNLMAPPTPSTSRSFHTARSQGSARAGGRRSERSKSPKLPKPKPPDHAEDSSDLEEEPFNFTFGSGAIVSKT